MPPVTNGDFEWGWLGGWTPGGTEVVAASTASAHSPIWAARLGDPQRTCLNGVKGGTAFVQQQLNVPSGSPVLSFWYRMLSEDVAYSDYYHKEGDALKVLVLDSSGASSTLGTFGQPYRSNVDCGQWWDSGWTQATYDLTAFAGQTVTLKFVLAFDDIDGGLNTYAYLDDVAIN